MTTEVAIYRKLNVAHLIEPQTETISTQLRKELGFERQQPPHSSPRIQKAALFWPQLSPKEFAIWEWYLPTMYLRGSGYNEWAAYNFDIIPDDALVEIKEAIDMKVFDFMEIRTPERKHMTDPVVIGYVKIPGYDPIGFLIVRWGESLIPFEEIRRQYIRRSPIRWLRTFLQLP